jgi:hypothetical protein
MNWIKQFYLPLRAKQYFPDYEIHKQLRELYAYFRFYTT